MTGPPRPSALVAEWWKVLFPIIGFFLGVGLIVFDNVFDPPGEISGTSGIGLICAGLGPAGLLDLLRKSP